MNAAMACLLSMLAHPGAYDGDGATHVPGGTQQERVSFHHEPERSAPPPVIRLSYAFVGRIAVGQTVDVPVVVSSLRRLTALSAHVYAHDGLIVAPPSPVMTDLEPGELFEWTLRVTPYVDGPLRLSVVVQGLDRDTVQSGQITVPVFVGDPGSAPGREAPGVNTDAGPSVISLPASEP